MTDQERLMEYLKLLQQIQPFSLGLHTTTGVETAESICENGLFIKGDRVVEGTLKLRGDMSQVEAEDIDFFFPYTNVTVIVAIPEFFHTPRITDNKGGYEIMCEFSRFIDHVSTMEKKKYPNYTYKDTSRIPPEFVVGYYDKDFIFVENKKCKMFSDSNTVERIKNEYNECKPMMDFMDRLMGKNLKRE